ncbi:MAG: SEC59/DGK1/VTE5 family protein [Bacteroidota bacterium]|nr:SEC59/DGK1/VTE5 family protein [Bacteroidota bacterium]
MFENIQNIEKNYKIEFIRKSIHFCSLSIPVVYFFIDKITTLNILIPITALFVVFDLARYYYQPAAKLFYKFFGWLLRDYEIDNKRKRLNGASNILISAIICVIIFPKIITVTAFSVLIISDSLAALIGRRFGKRKFFKKSLEGSLAFIGGGLIVIFLTPKVDYFYAEYLIAAFAVIVAAFFEAASTVLDDNFTVPISIGFVMWLLYLLFLPTLNLYIIG